MQRQAIHHDISTAATLYSIWQPAVYVTPSQVITDMIIDNNDNVVINKWVSVYYSAGDLDIGRMTVIDS